MTTQLVNFGHGLLSAAPKTADFVGGIYFSEDDNRIGLCTAANGTTSTYEWYGGNVKSASMVNSVLTISMNTGASVVLDFGDVASAKQTMQVFETLQTAIDGKAANTIKVIAGDGLSGGGDLKTDKTIIHATPAGATSKTSGLYKIATDKFGHVTGTTAPVSSDITGIIGGGVYDVSGAAATALSSAKSYTDLSITDLDSTVSAGGTPVASGTMVITGIVETDGLLKSVTSTEVEKAGAAATALSNAKLYADSLVDKAMHIKGTIGTTGDVTTLPTTGVKVGDSYVVITAGTYATQVCEIGDIILATSTTPTWTVLQNNLDVATADKLGTIKIGYTPSGKNYPVVLDVNDKAYVNVPWADTTYTLAGLGGVGAVNASGTSPLTMSATKTGTTVNITGSVAVMNAATASAAGSAGLVPAPAVGKQSSFLKGDGTWAIPINTDTTYTFASGSAGNFTVTPSGGSAQPISIGKPATAGTADVASSANKVAYGLSIQLNGGTATSFDGSSTKSINITPAIIGAATKAQGDLANTAIQNVSAPATSYITSAEDASHNVTLGTTLKTLEIAILNNDGLATAYDVKSTVAAQATITGYIKQTAEPLLVTDTINKALGKLEAKANAAVMMWYSF